MSEGYVIGFRGREATTSFAVYREGFHAGDKIVVSEEGNEYLGKVVSSRKIREGEDISAYLPMVRIASDNDIKTEEENYKRDEGLVHPIQEEADAEGLAMKIFKVETSLDHEKVRIFYTADERVDFRNLLRSLARMVHARIEMRQVGPRDKAKMTGGLGVCGLPLCCSTFLREFEGISISMAKNQMLAISQEKLSGQCGKLLCCLRYEDDVYSQEKTLYPKVNSPFVYDGKNVKVSSINILSKTVTLLESQVIKDETTGRNTTMKKYTTITLDEYNAVKEGKTYVPVEKEKYHPLNESGSLPSSSDFGIATSAPGFASVNYESELKKPGLSGKISLGSNRRTDNHTLDYASDNTRRRNDNKGNRGNKRNQNSNRKYDPSDPFLGEERWMYHGKNGLKAHNKGTDNKKQGGNKGNNNNNQKNNNSRNSSRPNPNNNQKGNLDFKGNQNQNGNRGKFNNSKNSQKNFNPNRMKKPNNNKPTEGKKPDASH